MGAVEISFIIMIIIKLVRWWNISTVKGFHAGVYLHEYLLLCWGVFFFFFFFSCRVQLPANVKCKMKPSNMMSFHFSGSQFLGHWKQQCLCSVQEYNCSLSRLQRYNNKTILHFRQVVFLCKADGVRARVCAWVRMCLRVDLSMWTVTSLAHSCKATLLKRSSPNFWSKSTWYRKWLAHSVSGFFACKAVNQRGTENDWHILCPVSLCVRQVV